MLSLESQSISELLGREFAMRQQRNRAYSLRAFARDLKMSPSRLSEVLKGQQGLSETTVDAVSQEITQRLTERKFIKDLVLAEFSRNPRVRALARERVDELRKSESFRAMREDQFRIIQDWYHGAILELIHIKDFKPDLRWIGKRLGIPATTAKRALERLQNVGLVEISADGGWRAHPEAFRTFTDIPSKAIRHFHLQILNMHAESLREDPMHDREFLSMIMAIPRSRMTEFKEEMNKFMTHFWKKIENDPKDDLYSLSVQLCPVRNRRHDNENA